MEQSILPGPLFILFVRDQQASRDFYAYVLGKEPVLDVPGMTQFQLESGSMLGLMPSDNIRRILGERLPDPQKSDGIPRSEVYLFVTNPEQYHARALSAGAVEVSPIQTRDWGDLAGYSLDLDGHLLAFAKESAI